MDPESSPELPPLKRGTYDLDAILAAAENAEFAIPPPPSKTSFNSNPFASSTPSAFRSNFSPSQAAAPTEDPDGTVTSPPPSRPSSGPRKPLSSSSATKKRVSTLKSTLGRFSAPKKVDLEPMMESPSDNITFGTASFLDKPAERSIDKDLSGDQASTSVTENEDWNSTSFTVDATSPSSISSQLSNSRKGRPIRPTPFARVASPALSSSHLEPVVNSPSRTGSPNNLSSGSLGAVDPTYSTPSSSRPTSRPTSRPHSRVSSNGRYHSRQLSSDSLTSFNAMIDKEDIDEPGHTSGGPFIVSDPEHLRILESEIEDPFSPSMSAIDPDTDAYLSKLIQQSSPFGPRKSPSRGQSPFKSRRNQRGDEDSFMDSTDEGLSDKELNSRFRTPKTGARTPTSPLARAVTRGRAGLSLDQIVRNQDPDSFSQVPNLTVNEQATNGFGPPTADLRPTSNGQIHGSPPKDDINESDIEQHVQVDIVVQNVNVGDDLNHHASPRKGGEQYMSDFEDETPFYQSNAEVLDEEELQLHDSGDFHETHAQSFAEWMSSSAEISRLEIAPPALGIMPIPSFSAVMTATALSVNGPSVESPSTTSLPSATSTGASVLTSSYTPAISSPEPPNSTPSTSPSASKRLAIIEKRSHLLDDLLSKARERTKHRSETPTTFESNLEKEHESTIAPSPSEAIESPSVPSVTFAEVNDVKVVEPESEAKEQDPDSSMSLDKKEHGLVRRPSGILLSSRIRDSTNLDAPRYSIREMEDMKKNVRMDLRIEITNEIREEYERTAEQEAAMYQFEIDELKAALAKEQHEKQQLKNVLDEFETSLADIAVSTAKEIQTLKEDNKRLSEGKSDTEDAFMQLKVRYDELRSLNSKHVENEVILRKAVETLKDDFETSESRYESVKAHADTKLSQASKEMEQARNTYETEIAMLRAQVNRQEVHMRTLETTLETKTKENDDLIMFSEELIAKLS
ncbi:Transforming acidic coiled-coil-containing protein 3 [Mortierella antarctica]|nr:Transforming acidic coiled-coil-containing protein 3 [Mortierella antarctica]